MRRWALIAADLVVLLFCATIYVPLAFSNLDSLDKPPLQTAMWWLGWAALAILILLRGVALVRRIRRFANRKAADIANLS
jgi:DMSO/TMAO reductase YedYZ heme-binding membrane subunit